MKPFIRGGDKNHNPRKGTETSCHCHSKLPSFLKIRTTIPVRGRKRSIIISTINHTRTTIRTTIPVRGRKLYLVVDDLIDTIYGDKNHNPRKGTETKAIKVLNPVHNAMIRTTIPVRGRKQRPIGMSL